MYRKMMMYLTLASVLSMLTVSGTTAQADTPGAGLNDKVAAVAPLADPHTAPYEILKYCKLSKKIKGIRKIPLRRGTDKWGWVKIVAKHNINNYAAICTVTRYGNPTRVNGTQYRAKVLARLRACKPDGTQCRTVKTILVIQGFDIRLIDRTTRFGIVTTYCKGYPRACPAWVTAALNTRAARSTGSVAYQIAAAS